MAKVITAIKVQKRNPDRLNIELDGEFGFGISRMTGAWLKQGDMLSDEKIASLQERDGFEVAYQRAISLINYRTRTEKELRDKLVEKEIPVELIDQVLERLRNAHLVQDSVYAKMWVENRNEVHPRSQRLTRYELLQKGIAEEDIRQALEDAASDEELAERAARKYFRRLKGSDWLTFNRKLSDHLARRGFSYSTITPLVKLLWREKVDEQGILINDKEN